VPPKEEEAESMEEELAPEEVEEMETGSEDNIEDKDEERGDETEERTRDDSEMGGDADVGTLQELFGFSDDEAATFVGFEGEEQVGDLSRDETLPRTSGRISHPPPRLNYFQMGGDPMSISQHAGGQDEEEEMDPTVEEVRAVPENDNTLLDWIRTKSRQLSGNLRGRFTVGAEKQ